MFGILSLGDSRGCAQRAGVGELVAEEFGVSDDLQALPFRVVFYGLKKFIGVHVLDLHVGEEDVGFVSVDGGQGVLRGDGGEDLASQAL